MPDSSDRYATDPAATGTPAARPYWIPEGVEFDTLPAELKAAITGVIDPAYRLLVLETAPGLEQSTGLTIVHLLWLEILDQLELGRLFALLPEDNDSSRGRMALIAQYLRVATAKHRMSGFLLRLQELTRKKPAFAAAPRPRDQHEPEERGA